MAINPENRIPSTAEKNEIFYDRNTKKISYKNENGIVSPIGGGDVQSINSDTSGVVSIDNTDPVNPIVDFNGVNVDGVTVTGDGTPSNPLSATGQSTSPTVQVVLFADLATTEALKPCTYNNGVAGVGATLTGNTNGQLSTISFSDKIDNVTTALNQVILVRAQPITTNPLTNRGFQNGVYLVTQLGSTTEPFILTRIADADTQAELFPIQVNVFGGSVFGTRAFLQSTVDPVVGTSNIVFTAAPLGITNSAVLHMDTVTASPLPSCTYTSSTNPSLPGVGATLVATANGVFPIPVNGVTLTNGRRVLVKDQLNAAHNGSYTVASVGSNPTVSPPNPGTPWRLVRTEGWGGNFTVLDKEWKINNPASTKYGARYSTNLLSLSNTNVGITPISFTEVTTSAFNQQIQNAGSNVIQRNIVNFTGAGVTVSDTGTVTQVSIPGGGGSGTITYSNVVFVDAVNGNDSTGLENRFDRPFLTIPAAIAAANNAPSSTSRNLIYIRKGTYNNSTTGSILLRTHTDLYFEPGTVTFNTTFTDNGGTINCNIYGKAYFAGTSFGTTYFSIFGSSTNIYIEFDYLETTQGAMFIGGGSNVTVFGRRISAGTINTGYGISIRTSGRVSINITEEISAAHDVIDVRDFSGIAYITCPRLFLTAANVSGADFKHVVIIRDSLGGEVVINGNLIVNNSAGYYGGISGVIGRWANSFGTLRLNGNIYAENQIGIYALGSSGSSRTIINGDVRTSNLVTFTSINSTVVFRNGTLLNTNQTPGSEGYPVMSVAQSGGIWVENCHIHSLGTGNATISAFWKDSTVADINVYNSVYSAADTSGFFIRNSVVGQPQNNVRILNCRSTKPLDINILDELTPSGFVQDSQIRSINFI